MGLAELIAQTGNRALTGFTAPKLLWLRRHEPESYARIASVMLPKDYVRLRLCGEKATDVADASGTLLFDVARRRWSAPGARRARAGRGWLPPALESPERLGHDGGRRAGGRRRRGPGRGRARSGRGPAGPGVGGDRHLGGGVHRARRVRGRSRGARARLLPRGARGLARDGRDAVGGRARCAGCATWPPRARTSPRWWPRPSAGSPGPRGSPSCPTSPGERTPHADPDARGAFAGLSVRHDRGALVRAVLEGVAFGLRDSLDLVAEMGDRARRSGASRAAARAATCGCGSSPRCSSSRWSAPRSTRAPPSAPRCSAGWRAASGGRARGGGRDRAHHRRGGAGGGVGRALPRGPRALPGAVSGSCTCEGRRHGYTNWYGQEDHRPGVRARLGRRPQELRGLRRRRRRGAGRGARSRESPPPAHRPAPGGPGRAPGPSMRTRSCSSSTPARRATGSEEGWWRTRGSASTAPVRHLEIESA